MALLNVIEYPDSAPSEMVHRIPESGSGEWQLGDWTTHACAFGTVACFFWNWSLKDSFLDQVQLWARTPFVRIHYHL